jgi:hypothetical protein
VNVDHAAQPQVTNPETRAHQTPKNEQISFTNQTNKQQFKQVQRCRYNMLLCLRDWFDTLEMQCTLCIFVVMLQFDPVKAGILSKRILQVSVFLEAAVFVSLNNSQLQATDDQQQWFSAFAMLTFYVFLATIMLLLPAVGWGTWTVSEVRFLFALAKSLFCLALLFLGITMFLRGSRWTFGSDDYGFLVGGGIGAAFAFIIFMGVFMFRGVFGAIQNLLRFITYFEDEVENPGSSV